VQVWFAYFLDKFGGFVNTHTSPANIRFTLIKILIVRTHVLKDQALIKVLKGLDTDRRPVWFMRQAGRYLPEYRKVRERAGSFLDLCYSPQLAAEVTLQPLRRYDLDAAIIFADILVVPHAMGNGLSFVEGEGPVLETVRSADDVVKLGSGAGSDMFAKVGESLSCVRAELDPNTALIGFCGAPWTVASYMIEGRSSKRELALKCAADGEPWFVDLMDRLIESSITYLNMQVDAGADALQIFDSWAGDLPGRSFADYSIAPIARIIAGVRSAHADVPIIVFAKGAGMRHADVYAGTRCDGVGIEAEWSMREAIRVLPQEAVVQGNLDPRLLLGDNETMLAAVRDILTVVPRRRHIFNLGHGIVPQTDPDTLSHVVAEIRRFDRG
jgi:uroporphyrinogen decarboxylase